MMRIISNVVECPIDLGVTVIYAMLAGLEQRPLSRTCSDKESAARTGP